MNSTRTGSAGNYSRRKSPNGTPGSRYRETLGPGDTKGFYAFLSAEVTAGRMTEADRRRRVMLGK